MGDFLEFSGINKQRKHENSFSETNHPVKNFSNGAVIIRSEPKTELSFFGHSLRLCFPGVATRYPWGFSFYSGVETFYPCPEGSYPWVEGIYPVPEAFYPCILGCYPVPKDIYPWVECCYPRKKTEFKV